MNWEKQRTTPGLPYMPRIIEFLGYNPIAQPASFSEQLRRFRRGQGLSQESFAKMLRVDPGTLRRWESGKNHPSERHRTAIDAFLKR